MEQQHGDQPRGEQQHGERLTAADPAPSSLAPARPRRSTGPGGGGNGGVSAGRVAALVLLALVVLTAVGVVGLLAVRRGGTSPARSAAGSDAVAAPVPAPLPAPPRPVATPSPRATPPSPPASPTPPRAVAVRSVRLLHPGGSGQDDPGGVDSAVDGDPATAWRTQRYSTARFGNLRPGVGLLLDLGVDAPVREVRLALDPAGVGLRVHAGATRAGLLSTAPLLRRADAPRRLTLSLARPVRARFWAVWFDRLPERGPHRAGVAEVSLLR